jgi:hypothetical protein
MKFFVYFRPVILGEVYVLKYVKFLNADDMSEIGNFLVHTLLVTSQQRFYNFALIFLRYYPHLNKVCIMMDNALKVRVQEI